MPILREQIRHYVPVGYRSRFGLAVSCAAVVMVSMGSGCTSDGGSASTTNSPTASASSSVCKNQLGPVAAPASVRRLDHSVHYDAETTFDPPPPGDPAVDAAAALRVVQQHHANALGEPLTATLVSMTSNGVTNVEWLLTVQDVSISGKGGPGEACRAQTFMVDATTGALGLGLIGPSSPVG